MGAPAAGEVILVTFPFSDLSESKLRPAVVLANAGRGDWILCQITSNPYSDPNTVRLTDADFLSGSLHKISYARPAKLFTANGILIDSILGRLSEPAFKQIIDATVSILRNCPSL